MAFKKTWEGIAIPLSGDSKMSGKLRIGDTVTGAGDMSSDTAGKGIALTVAADDNFCIDVYGDDGGTALTAGWVSSVFGSFVNYAAVTGGANVSIFGVSGQVHAGAAIASIGNVAGIFGVAECDSAVTLACNFFGGNFGATVPSGTIIGSGYYTGGIMIGGNYQGTLTGHAVAIFVQNPTGTAQFDAFVALGQDSKMAGCVTAAAVGGSNTHKIKVYVGGTLMYVPVYTA